MTLIVGILCSDGVVVASDSYATYAEGSAPTIGQQRVDKVLKLGDGALYASSGAIGMAQVLSAAIEQLQNAGTFSRLPDLPKPSTEAMKAISAEIRKQVAPIIQSAAGAVPLIGMQNASVTAIVKSLVAVAVKKRACLFQFDYSGAPEEATEQLPFVALGSGQPIADPFLAFLKRVLWTERQPTVAEGRLVAAWTIMHVSSTNFGGVGLPIQLATLTIRDGKPHITYGDPAEHVQAVDAAETALRDHVIRHGEAAKAETVPEPPAPPTAPP